METAVIGLFGVIVGAILTVVLTTAKDWWFHRVKKKEEQTYLSIQISCLLEQFVSGCLNVAYDDGLYHGQRNELGYLSPQALTPNFEPLKVDVNWKSLPTNLMYKILRLPSQIDNANAYINAAGEHASTPPDFEEFFEARMEKYSGLGLQTIKLIEALKELVNLPPEPPKDDWVPQERLQHAYDKVNLEVAERQKRNQQAMNEISIA